MSLCLQVGALGSPHCAIYVEFPVWQLNWHHPTKGFKNGSERTERRTISGKRLRRLVLRVHGVINLDWLTDRLVAVLKWQLANPDRKDDAPEVPFAGRRVWSIFLELNATRSIGMAPNPISFGEIEAWSRMHREPVRPFELDMLRALDAAYLEAARAGQEESGDEPLGPPMTPGLFNAVFKGQRPKQAVSSRPFSMKLFDAWFPGG
jgi:hypothetical protein